MKAFKAIHDSGHLFPMDHFHTSRPFPACSGFFTRTSIVLAFTSKSFHASKENATFATPKSASSGTRTGPWNSATQQRFSSKYRFLMGLPPEAFAGNSPSTVGWTSFPGPKPSAGSPRTTT